MRVRTMAKEHGIQIARELTVKVYYRGIPVDPERLGVYRGEKPSQAVIELTDAIGRLVNLLEHGPLDALQIGAEIWLDVKPLYQVNDTEEWPDPKH